MKNKQHKIYPVKDNEIMLPNGKIRRIDKKYSIDEVLNKRNFLPKKLSTELFDGDPIYMNSLRYHTFAKGLKCMCGDPNCRIEGKYFYKERNIHMSKYHFNLYGVDGAGNEFLMTKDHIIPKSRGGNNSLENLQTMSEKCNGKKGNIIVDEKESIYG